MDADGLHVRRYCRLVVDYDVDVPCKQLPSPLYAIPPKFWTKREANLGCCWCESAALANNVIPIPINGTLPKY